MTAPPTRWGAVETGGTWCVVGVGTNAGELLEVDRFATGDPDETIARCAQWLRARGPLERIGVGAFGPITLDRGSPAWGVVGATPKPGWEGATLGPTLAAAAGCDVVLDTDVNAAALAEQRWGAGAGARSLAYITIGTGIGAGLVIDDRTVRGLQHPELGHMLVRHDHNADPFEGICPYHGDCLEGLASGPAIAARWDADPASLAPHHPAWDLEAGYLAEAIMSLTYIMSPHRVILGGGVGHRADLLELVREHLTRVMANYLTPPELHTPGIPDGRSGVLGAIALAIDRPL